MSELELTAQWIAVVVYAAATLAAGFGLCFGRSRPLGVAVGLVGCGVVAQAIGLTARWLGAGHAPFLGRYEAYSSYALVVGLVFLVLQWKVAPLRAGSPIVAPVLFLLLGAGLLSPAAPTYPSPALRSPWLTVHVSVAKLALATAVAFGTTGLVALAGGRPGQTSPSWGPTVRLELLSQRLLGYTFFLMSVVLLSGSLWANAAWGSYWSWDPVETWSLAFWAACALVLHLRTGASWRGPRWSASVVALAALGLVSFLGYGHFGLSLHFAYVAP